MAGTHASLENKLLTWTQPKVSSFQALHACHRIYDTGVNGKDKRMHACSCQLPPTLTRSSVLIHPHVQLRGEGLALTMRTCDSVPGKCHKPACIQRAQSKLASNVVITPCKTGRRLGRHSFVLTVLV